MTDQSQSILERIRSGESYREIERTTGATYHAIRKLAKTAGIRSTNTATRTPGTRRWNRPVWWEGIGDE